MNDWFQSFKIQQLFVSASEDCLILNNESSHVLIFDNT